LSRSFRPAREFRAGCSANELAVAGRLVRAHAGPQPFGCSVDPTRPYFGPWTRSSSCSTAKWISFSDRQTLRRFSFRSSRSSGRCEPNRDSPLTSMTFLKRSYTSSMPWNGRRGAHIRACGVAARARGASARFVEGEADRGQDPVAVAADGPRELDERVQPGSGRPGEPGVEVRGREGGSWSW
jgi:hypothetical protein